MRASRPGVGYLSILHKAVTESSFEAAVAAVRSAPRAAAHTYWVADADRALELECDPALVVERELEAEAIVQTNHCQAQALAAREGEAPSASSQRRLARARALLAEPNQDFASIEALFADREEDKFILEARVGAEPFYERLGFETISWAMVRRRHRPGG